LFAFLFCLCFVFSQGELCETELPVNFTWFVLGIVSLVILLLACAMTCLYKYLLRSINTLFHNDNLERNRRFKLRYGRPIPAMKRLFWVEKNGSKSLKQRSRYHRDNLVIFTIETLDHENGSESGPKIALEMRMKSWDTIYDVARCETVSFLFHFCFVCFVEFPSCV